MRWLAEAAGYNDSEQWWEDMVEYRRDRVDLFTALLEAMIVLRAEVERAEQEEAKRQPAPLTTHDSPLTKREAQREAWMRQTIRAAGREDFRRIAVVCGAWHAPALAGTLADIPGIPNAPSAQEDAAALKNLPKTKVQATWVPWTYGRLCFASGYGTGIESPGWYHHL